MHMLLCTDQGSKPQTTSMFIGLTVCIRHTCCCGLIKDINPKPQERSLPTTQSANTPCH